MITKKTLLSNIALLAFGIALAVGLSYVSAASFSGPTATAPDGNTETPVNVGSLAQIKAEGDCTSGNCGGLSVDAFTALQNAEFDGDAYFDGILYGGTPSTAAPLTIGGSDSKGLSRPTSVDIAGGLSVFNRMKSADITSTAGSALCADADGVVVKCADSADMCTNIVGVQTAVPDGDVRAADGSCSFVQKRFYSKNTDEKDYEQDLTGAILHTPTLGGTPALLATLGIDNDNPRGWQINGIPGIEGTGPFHTTLLSVYEKGTYNIKISSEGKLGERASNQGDVFNGGVDFYLKVNDTYTSLVPAAQKKTKVQNNTIYGTTDEYGKYTQLPYGNHEAYPIASDTLSDFSLYHSDDSGWASTGGSGKKYTFTPYKFDFEKTVDLNAGDTVEVIAYIYGATSGGNTFLGVNDRNGHDIGFLLTATSTIFDVTKTK